MSLKPIPGLGKSGISRISGRRGGRADIPSMGIDSAGDLAQVADQQEVLQVGRHGREVLERLERLCAPLRVARAQRRSEDLLEQVRLAVGRGAEDPQVAPAYAVARELGDGADDLALGLGEVAHAAALLALDQAVLFELAYELRIGLRLLQHVIERIQR